MTIQAILPPVVAQVFLTLVLFLLMANARRRAFRSGAVRWPDIALRQKPWPEQAQKISHCVENQFEAPVLFYLLAVLAILTKTADLAFVIMAWIFVATRLGHAYVFITSNYVPARGLLFVIGLIDLFLMWIIFAVRVFVPAFAAS